MYSAFRLFIFQHIYSSFNAITAMCENKSKPLDYQIFFFCCARTRYERIAISLCPRSLKLGLELDNINKTDEIFDSAFTGVILWWFPNFERWVRLNDAKTCASHKIRIQVIYFVWKLYFLMTTEIISLIVNFWRCINTKQIH